MAGVDRNAAGQMEVIGNHVSQLEDIRKQISAEKARLVELKQQVAAYESDVDNVSCKKRPYAPASRFRALQSALFGERKIATIDLAKTEVHCKLKQTRYRVKAECKGSRSPVITTKIYSCDVDGWRCQLKTLQWDGLDEGSGRKTRAVLPERYCF